MSRHLGLAAWLMLAVAFGAGAWWFAPLALFDGTPSGAWLAAWVSGSGAVQPVAAEALLSFALLYTATFPVVPLLAGLFHGEWLTAWVVYPPLAAAVALGLSASAAELRREAVGNVEQRGVDAPSRGGEQVVGHPE